MHTLKNALSIQTNSKYLHHIIFYDNITNITLSINHKTISVYDLIIVIIIVRVKNYGFYLVI